MSFTDAIFESTSGITTTGATVINNLEATSHGILIWRALLQWLGGVGIIVMALAVLPMLSIGCLLYTSPSPRDRTRSRMPSSA